MTESRVTRKCSTISTRKEWIPLTKLIYYQKCILSRQLSSTKVRSCYNKEGASFHKTEVSIAGVRKSAIDAHPPYQQIHGDPIRGDTAAFGEWTLSLPDTSTPLYLDF